MTTGTDPSVYCSCGAQWHGHQLIDAATHVIAWHEQTHGLVPHEAFLQVMQAQRGLCRCDACVQARAERRKKA